jgi:hypothetical protein
MLVPYFDIDQDSPYQKYCDEMVKDKRAGICNVSKDVQIYIVPPSLKKNVTVLRYFYYVEY